MNFSALLYALHHRQASWLLIVTLCAGLAALPASAQHDMHAMDAGEAKHVATLPMNDAVLERAPESIRISFESDVRLVKLALKEPSQGKEPMDIGFRYRPDAAMHFEQELPLLPAADYYVVEWAAFDENSSLVKGTFYFTFGVDAKPPSFYRNDMEHMQNIISPDYRLL